MELKITKVIIEGKYEDKEAIFEFDDVKIAEVVIVNRDNITEIKGEPGHNQAKIIIKTPYHYGKEKSEDTRTVISPKREDKKEQENEV